MHIIIRALAIVVLTSTASSAFAAVSVGLGLSISGNAEVKVTPYICQGQDDPLTVQYVNAAPNFLALIPVEEQTLIFVNTISGSGAKYESGRYIWWNKGTDATLSDVTEGLDAAPVLMCSENIDTP